VAHLGYLRFGVRTPVGSASAQLSVGLKVFSLISSSGYLTFGNRGFKLLGHLALRPQARSFPLVKSLPNVSIEYKTLFLNFSYQQFIKMIQFNFFGDNCERKN